MTDRGGAIKSILKKIDGRGKSLLKSQTPWEEGMLDFMLPTLTTAETRLVADWISAWRDRIIRANGVRKG